MRQKKVQPEVQTDVEDLLGSALTSLYGNAKPTTKTDVVEVREERSSKYVEAPVKQVKAVDAEEKNPPKEQVPTSNTTNATDQPITANPLWQEALASKARKSKEKQVWLDADLYRKVEMLNIKHGKPVPTKHLLNAIIKLFFDRL